MTENLNQPYQPKIPAEILDPVTEQFEREYEKMVKVRMILFNYFNFDGIAKFKSGYVHSIFDHTNVVWFKIWHKDCILPNVLKFDNYDQANKFHKILVEKFGYKRV